MVVEQPHRVEAEGLSTGYQGPLPALLGAWHSEATTTFQAKPRHLAGLEARALWLKQVVTESELSKPHALQRLGFQGGLDHLVIPATFTGLKMPVSSRTQDRLHPSPRPERAMLAQEGTRKLPKTSVRVVCFSLSFLC